MKKTWWSTSLFWKTVKPSFFDNLVARDRIHLKELPKYRNHPCVLAIHERKKTQVNFYFKDFFVKDTQKQILKLDNKNFDISTKIIKVNADIFTEYSCFSING